MVQSRFAETRFAETLTLTQTLYNPKPLTLISANREDTPNIEADRSPQAEQSERLVYRQVGL